jgi:hypothetical protein
MAITKIPAAGFTGNNFRNIVINGDMSIAQRATSVASITGDGNGYYTIDRMVLQVATAGTWTMSQDTDVPTGQGFAKSLKLDCTTANGSLSAGSYLILDQRFEGQNLQYLKKGTANAVSLTASFWVKSTKTGTFIVNLRDNDNSRNISKSYTIDVSNTWEKKTITYEGDTTGAFDNDNANSFQLLFFLAAGSDRSSGTLATTWESTVNANRAVGQVNLADDTANDFYITGVQLEAGTTASDFEFLPVDVNLARCQRYHQTSIPIGSFFSSTTGVGAHHVLSWSDGNVTGKVFPTPMRATPTITLRKDSATTTGVIDTSAGEKSASVSAVNSTSIGFLTVTSGAATNYAIYHYRADAEL